MPAITPAYAGPAILLQPSNGALFQDTTSAPDGNPPPFIMGNMTNGQANTTPPHIGGAMFKTVTVGLNETVAHMGFEVVYYLTLQNATSVTGGPGASNNAPASMEGGDFTLAILDNFAHDNSLIHGNASAVVHGGTGALTGVAGHGISNVNFFTGTFTGPAGLRVYSFSYNAGTVTNPIGVDVQDQGVALAGAGSITGTPMGMRIRAQTNGPAAQMDDDLWVTGRMLLGTTTAISSNTKGLHIDQGNTSDFPLSLAATGAGFTNPFTTYAPAATFGTFQRFVAATGALAIVGYGSSTFGLHLQGYAPSTNNTHGITAAAPLQIGGSKSDGGTGIAAVASADNLIAFQNTAAATVAVLRGDGVLKLALNTGLTAGGALMQTWGNGTAVPVVSLWIGTGAPTATANRIGDIYIRQDGGAGTYIYRANSTAGGAGSWTATAA